MKTSRELLVSVAGSKHELHSVVGRSRVRVFVTEVEQPRRVVKIACSCGESFEAPASEDNMAALRNVSVPEDRS